MALDVVNMDVGVRLLNKLLLIYWSFHNITTITPEFTENGPKKRKYQVGSSLVIVQVWLLPYFF